MRKKLKLHLVFFLCLLSLPGFGQEGDDEALIEEVQKSRAKQAQFAENLNQTIDPSVEINKLGYKEIDMKALSDVKVLEVIRKAFDQGALKKAPAEEVRMHLLQKLSPEAQSFLLEHPKLLDFSVDVLRDEKAMSSMIDILIRQSDLVKYSVIYVLLIFLGWLTKKIFVPKSWGRGMRILFGLSLNLSITVFSLVIFYQLFHKELTPIITVFNRHF